MYNSFLKDLIGLFAIVDPLAAIPLFLTLTNGYDKKKQLRVAKESAMAAFLILLCSLLFGKMLLQLIGISLPSLRVAGGLMFIIMGMQLLLENHKKSIDVIENEANISVVPLALPILSGPGAMGAVILLGSSGDNYSLIPRVGLIIAIVMFISYLCFRLAQPIGSRLGPNALSALVKLSGLTVVAIGVEFVVNGIRQMWF